MRNNNIVIINSIIVKQTKTIMFIEYRWYNFQYLSNKKRIYNLHNKKKDNLENVIWIIQKPLQFLFKHEKNDCAI